MKSADNALQNLIDNFNKYPNKYLTEDDVRIHLCHLLMNDFGKIEKTKDNDCSISLHTEVRWWGYKHSKYRSDIVLLDVADTQVTKKKILELKNHPQKGYSANKIKGVIEIKFRRNKGDSDNQFLKKIKSDYDKLKEIKKMINVGNENKDTFYNLIVLDKKQDMENKLYNLTDEIDVKYKFANKYYENT
jgi:hypothetical protein